MLEFFPVEQAAFRGGVTLHIAVEIQMIACQVGEQRDIEVHTVHPALCQRMRGHFHCDRLRTLALILSQ
jgi:hypothetical protein